MICPHCRKPIESGANGPLDVVQTFVNLNGANGCNPLLFTTVAAPSIGNNNQAMTTHLNLLLNNGAGCAAGINPTFIMF